MCLLVKDYDIFCLSSFPNPLLDVQRLTSAPRTVKNCFKNQRPILEKRSCQPQKSDVEKVLAISTFCIPSTTTPCDVTGTPTQ